MGERKIPVKNVESEEYSFFTEFQSFARSILLDKQPYLNAENGSGTIAILNAAQLSENIGRKAVMLDELKDFSLRALEKENSIWKAADILAADFNRQFL